MNSTRLVACLGNPGQRYRMTWHNAGFWVADILAMEAGVKFLNAGLFLVAELPEDVHLIKPTVYMNRSGKAVEAFLQSGGYSPSELLVVCDDVNLDLGRLRLRGNGSSGGHNGLQSVIDCTGTEDFPRLRLGVGPAPSNVDLADFVLDSIPESSEEEASIMAHRAADCVKCHLSRGISVAQEIYNRRPSEE